MVTNKRPNVAVGVVATKVDRVVSEVVITMSKEDAIVLQKVLCNVSGDPEGPRGVVDNISSALETIGICSFWDDPKFRVKGDLHISEGKQQ